MDRLIWTAVTGMSASMARERMIASNMANAQTPGFRAETMQFTPMTLIGPSLEARAMTDAAVHGADMSEGSINQTGRPLDVALTGQGLIAVQSDQGEEAYTRRGDLSLTAAGLLVNGEGRPVLGEGGPISVPPGSHVTIGEDGAVLVADPSAPGAPPQRLETIKLVSWRGSKIEKGLDGLFRVEGGGVLPTDAEARLQPGMLEQSNVRPSQVLTEMVEAQRLFDIRTKLIATAKDVDESSSTLMRLSA